MAGTIGTILAVVGILNYFTPIMSILSAMIPPVAGVMIASYWVIHKGKTDSWQEVEGVNRLGVFSWLVGAVIACMPVVFSLFPALPATKPTDDWHHYFIRDLLCWVSCICTKTVILEEHR